MIKYILLTILVIGLLVTLYQLYLSNSWTNMIKQKQQEYTQTPSITVNNKAMYHRVELCAIAMVCVFALPSQLNNQTFRMAKEEASAVAESDDINYLDSNESVAEVDELKKPTEAMVATSTHNEGNEPTSLSVMKSMTNGSKEVTVSLEMLVPSATYLETEDFLALFTDKEMELSSVTSIETCDYIVHVSSVEFGDRDLLFKEEETEYLLCDSIDEVCYVITK